MGNCIRKSQKKQIEDMLAMLDRAHEAIKKALETGKSDIALSLLEQCQEIAIQMGEMLEKSFGEDFATVGMLESYCERIYQIYESLQQQQSVNVGKMYKSIRKELIRIENSIKNDIVVRTVAVFLPYKASMWDSLESVWQAADADPNCDASVVPIPYFDKNPDGSFKEMHYEGSEYPEYVPITSWQEYDIAKEHPDMIFIHNPYDEFNLVTSVPPAYYAKELRNHTDQLVYIPYFILGEIEPDNEKAVEGIEHFCAVPAVAYADKVIVQSEKMRQIYIDVMSKTMGRDTRKIWEKKILGLGSPKIDRVQSAQKNELEIPKDWLKVIEKPDGSRKKIILYNTSVSALLQHSEKMLQKLMYVFHIFKENQDEVALLWRPHPLIKATIESMRPQLWIEYDKFVSQYKEEGWGIYDDTADVDRAIALSDAYYGDPSSVVQMYEQTDRPIMMQDIDILKSRRYQYNIAATEAICSYQGNYYFVFLEAPVLCKMNQETLKCEPIYLFDAKKERSASRLYRKIIPYKNRLFLIPYFADRIAIYDMASKEMSFIVLNEEYVDIRDYQWHTSPKFEDALVDGKFLYMIPESYHAVIMMDMENLTLKEIPLGKKGSETFYYCVLGSACLQEMNVIFPVFSEGSICVYNTVANEIGRVYPTGQEKRYSNIFSIGDELWLIPAKIYEGIDIWDLKHQMVKETLVFDDEINAMSRKNTSEDFRAGFLRDRKLYLLSCRFESSLIIDLDLKKAIIWNLPNIYEKDEFLPYRYDIRYTAILFQNNKIVICGLRGEWWECIGNNIQLIKKQSVWNKEMTKILGTKWTGEIVSETGLDLNDFIKLDQECTKKEKMNLETSSGQIIYEYLCTER